jgi:TatD DNase family protein
MIDSHCHLDLDAFSVDREKVIQQAETLGVTRCHIPGTEAHRWQALLNFASRPFIDISLGLHPYFLNRYSAEQLNCQLNQLESLIVMHSAKIFAIGECGLDASIDCHFERQRDIFIAQIALAKAHAKPLIVHARKSHHWIVNCLNEVGFAGKGIIHAFSGSSETARHYTNRGWKLGIGGTITYPRGAKTR